jgi:hypothetical protein
VAAAHARNEPNVALASAGKFIENLIENLIQNAGACRTGKTLAAADPAFFPRRSGVTAKLGVSTW